MTKTTYLATFLNGETHARRSTNRTYTHAWRIRYRRPDGTEQSLIGFAGSRDLAEKAVVFEQTYLIKHDTTILAYEVVPTEEKP